MRLAASDSVMSCVLEADASIAITRTTKPGQLLECDILITTGPSGDARLERVQDAQKDRSYGRRDSRDLIGNRVQLLLGADLHGLDPSRCGSGVPEQCSLV